LIQVYSHMLVVIVWSIFGPGRRVAKSHSSSCCCCCWNQFSKGPKNP